MKIKIDKNINIELLVPAFFEHFFGLTNKNRAYLKKWLAWLDLVKTFDDTQRFIDTAVHQHKWGAIGYWLCASFAGKGVITKVVQQLLEYGFVENNLKKIEIRCAEKNYKSRAVPERLGFNYEATLRECEWLYTHATSYCVFQNDLGASI
jgi:ribosomal-protein-serine acetyltransferase